MAQLDNTQLERLIAKFKELFRLDQPELDFGIYRIMHAKSGEVTEFLEKDLLPQVRQAFAQCQSDVAALESEVYDHLYSFFRRYYSEGDFLSKRVYKEGVYAIPYEGEEIKLYWANQDQYYIKTSEYLRDYAFRLRPDDSMNPCGCISGWRMPPRVSMAMSKLLKARSASSFSLRPADFIAEEDGGTVAALRVPSSKIRGLA